VLPFIAARKRQGEIVRTLLAAVGAVLACGAGACATDAPLASDREDRLPTSEPLATVGGFVTRLDPLTLKPTGPRAELGEYHDAYSFAPDGSAIAFGISAPGPTDRVGIRLVDSRDLTVSGNVETGVYAAALAWLRPERLVALLGVGGQLPLPRPPHRATVVTVDPATRQVIERRELPFGDSPFHCDAAEAPERALIVLAGRRLFIVGVDGEVQTVALPRPFDRCGEVALAPREERAFAVAKGGGVVAEVALATSRLAVHRLPRGPAGEVEAVGLGPHTLAVAHRSRKKGRPNGVELLDAKRESRSTIDRRAGEARVSGGTVLTFDGPPFRGAAGIGVRGYRRGGHRRFQLLSGHIAEVEVAGRFAYAIRRDGVAIIDVRSGTVVNRSSARPPVTADLLTLPSRP
jgi:hypothetical protein